VQARDQRFRIVPDFSYKALVIHSAADRYIAIRLDEIRG
jgi:hypothetical protein